MCVYQSFSVRNPVGLGHPGLRHNRGTTWHRTRVRHKEEVGRGDWTDQKGIRVDSCAGRALYLHHHALVIGVI